SGLKRTQLTVASCISGTASGWRVWASHKRADLSTEALATTFPFGARSTKVISPEWFVRRRGLKASAAVDPADSGDGTSGGAASVKPAIGVKLKLGVCPFSK